MEHSPIDVEFCRTNEALYLARSEILDAFSDLESRVAVLLRNGGKTPAKGMSLGQRVQALRSIEPCAGLAKSNLNLRDQIADQIIDLLSVRADVVHSRMRPTLVDGKVSASFINSQELPGPFPLQRCLTLQDMLRMAEMVRKLTEKLAGLGRNANPASSQQPPSPPAKADP